MGNQDSSESLAHRYRRADDEVGSCAPDGVITLAQDLVDMPAAFQDYVVVHELLHLRYRSHGKAFTAMMTALVPGWRELEASSPIREIRR